MTTKKTFAALSLMFLLTACQASTQTETVTDTMMDEGSSSAMMEKSEDAMMEGESSLTFVGGSTIIDHDGGFTDFTIDVGNSADLMNSTVTATVNTTSVYTDSDGFTGHIKREDFFDVETYPTATFTSTEIKADGEDGYDIIGDLTIKGVTKSVTMDATMEGNLFVAEFNIPRKEFGIGNDSYGEKLLDEFVPVTATVYLQ